MKQQLIRMGWSLAASLGACGLASAQFTTLAPFNGNAQEGFETQDLSGGAFPVCVVDRVFSGQADLCTDNGNTGAHITTGWGFGCTMQEQEGSRFFGSTSGPARYSFDLGATRFGGYFGTNNPGASDGSIEFFDAAGTLLHSDVLTVPNDCGWTWHGWDTGGAVVASVRVSSNYSSGSYMMMDGMQADIVPASPGFEYCFCDGSAAPAPCGNSSSAAHGCSNSADSTGAHLTASGVASLSSNTLVLQGSGLVPGQPGLYFQGDAAVNGGAGTLLGDGLRCTGGNALRLQIVAADASGNSVLSTDVVAAQINPLAAGDTRRYQLWYRDPVNSPCGAGFNLSNGYEITWLP